MDHDDFNRTKLPNIRRSCFAHLKAYTPGEQPQNVQEWIKLNTNENPYEPPQAILDALNEAVQKKMRMYPDPLSKELRQAITEKFLRTFDSNLTIDNLVTANGSDESLDILFQTFIDPGDSVIYSNPSYGMYSVLADAHDAKKKVVTLDDKFQLPENFLTTFNPADKLLILCSPNNPNGDVFPLEEISRICESFPGIVFVDEAYGDFSSQTAISLIKKYPNLVVGRSFSKSFSLAAIRLGFMVANRAIIELFNTIRLPYNVSYLTQVAGIAGMGVWEDIRHRLDLIIKERESMTQFLRSKGFEILPSQANFVLIRFADSKTASHTFTELKKKKILVRYWTKPGLESYVRVTISTPENNTQFMTALLKIHNIEM
jgi:histidinol-phosphate aminotransferase